jgi:hypothetical protein
MSTIDPLLPYATDSGHDRLGEQLQIPTKDDELAAYAEDRFAIIFAKVGDRLEVRRQSSVEPNPGTPSHFGPHPLKPSPSRSSSSTNTSITRAGLSSAQQTLRMAA